MPRDLVADPQLRTTPLVKPTRLAATEAYYCGVCFLAYRTQDFAQKCEDHCKTHPSCDMAIGRQAIGSVEPEPEA